MEHFLQWSRLAPVARRSEAAQSIAHAYLTSPLSAEQRAEIEAVMTLLLDDSAADVRLALARELAPSGDAPHHIVLSLAADKPHIAALIAEHSPLLLDTELVEMVGRGDEALEMAIARRPFVSRALAAALAEVASGTACLALLTNAGAHVPRFSLDRIVARYGDRPDVRSTLLQREDLPLDVRQVLLGKLSAALRQLIVSHDWMPAERAETVTREARERATIAAAFDAPAESMPALVNRLIAAGELTPAFLIRAAASGQTLLFETALAALSGVPPARVRALLASGRAASLQALLQKARLPLRCYPAFAAAVDVLRSGETVAGASSDYRRSTLMMDAILARYDGRPDRELDPILALLRRFATEAKRAAVRGYAQQVMEAA